VANRRKFTQEKRLLFLESLALGNTVERAAESASVSARIVYEHRNTDAEFAAAWERALEAGTQVMEQEAFRRAVQGTTKPVVSGGQIIAWVREFSDTLLIFLLKARRPHIYREMTAQLGGTQQHLHLHGLSDEQRRAVLQLALNGAATQEFDDDGDGNADTGPDGG
jgi:hypothetical protein